MCVLLVNLTTLFADGFGFEHDLAHCKVYWNLDFEPSETSGEQSVALKASVFGLYFWDSIDHFVFGGDFFVF